jgi:type IV secretory pathway TrbD component
MNDKLAEHEFETADDAERFLVARVQREWGSCDHLTSVAFRDAGLVSAVAVRPAAPPGGASAAVSRVRWVIKDDNLALFDAILDGLKSAASVGFLAYAVSGVQAWSAAVGLSVAIFKLCRNMLRKGAVLDKRMFAVLAAVRSAKAVTAEQLYDLLCSSDCSWSQSEINDILSELQALPMRDGTPRQLVSRSAAGYWAAAGV